MTVERAFEYITAPTKPDGKHDAMGLKSDVHYTIHDCIIDLSGCELATLDEALGITLGAHGHVENCVIRGAGKLVLCGCGDDPADNPDVIREQGKCVTFKHCLFENFGRRGPEVQGGMMAVLSYCVVRNWGLPSRFDTRAFAAWAHKGGKIIAQHTVFAQEHTPSLWCRIRDHIGHFGQAINDRGLAGMFHRDAWLSGYRRALTAGPDGKVEANQCYGPGLVIDNHVAPHDQSRRRKSGAATGGHGDESGTEAEAIVMCVIYGLCLVLAPLVLFFAGGVLVIATAALVATGKYVWRRYAQGTL